MQAPTVLLAAVETAFNAWLSLDPAAGPRLAAFDGSVIAIDINGLEMSVYLLPGADGLQVLGHYEGDADTRIAGSPFDLMAMNGDREGALFSGRVSVSGDTQLGHRFQNLLAEVEIDWEEHLSHLLGDVAAHQVGRLARGLLGWGRISGGSLSADLADWLTEESRNLPTRYEVDEFLDAVDRTRSDVDRLEARVQRLKNSPQMNANERK